MIDLVFRMWPGWALGMGTFLAGLACGLWAKGQAEPYEPHRSRIELVDDGPVTPHLKVVGVEDPP